MESLYRGKKSLMGEGRGTKGKVMECAADMGGQHTGVMRDRSEQGEEKKRMRKDIERNRIGSRKRKRGRKG